MGVLQLWGRRATGEGHTECLCEHGFSTCQKCHFIPQDFIWCERWLKKKCIPTEFIWQRDTAGLQKFIYCSHAAYCSLFIDGERDGATGEGFAPWSPPEGVSPPRTAHVLRSAPAAGASIASIKPTVQWAEFCAEQQGWLCCPGGSLGSLFAFSPHNATLERPHRNSPWRNHCSYRSPASAS